MAETDKKLIGQVKLLNVRLSFADLFEPAKDRVDEKTGDTIKGKFKANFLMEKGTPETEANLAKCQKASLEAKIAKWGSDPAKHPKLKPHLVYLRDGNLESWDGYDGCFYVSANSDDMPVLIDRVKDEKGKWIELTKDNGGTRKLYSGAFVNCILRVWAQDNKHGKRVNCEVKVVQFVKNGPAFTGNRAVDPNESFDDNDLSDDDLDTDGFNGPDEIEDEDDSGLV